MKKRTGDFQKFLIEELKDPMLAAEYLNAIIEDGDMRLLMEGLKDLAQARGGMSKLSRKAKLNRGNLYKMLSKKSNPGIHSINTVLKTFGLCIGVFPDRKPIKRKRRAA